MAFVVSSKNQPSFSDKEKNNNFSEDRDESETLNSVSSHLYLKPSHASETLDKYMVLRRIRQRKRMNKVQNALQAILSPQDSGWSDKVSDHEQKWLEDAFSAP